MTLSLAEQKLRGPLWPELVFIAVGFVSSALTAYGLASVAVEGGISIHLYDKWFIPIGAMASGVAAASGYYAVARLLGRRPGTLAVVGMLASSVLTYVAVFYLEFRMIGVNGTHANEVMSFGTFVDAMIRGSSIRFQGFSRTRALGALGYPLVALHAGGFLIGGGYMAARLTTPLSCKRCRRHLPTPATAQAYGSEQELAFPFQRVHQLLEDGQGSAGMAQVESLSQREADYKLAIDLSRCESCRRQYYHLRLMRFVTDKWVPLSGFDKSSQVPSRDLVVSLATSEPSATLFGGR
jgi:hypothetical protein